MPLTGVNDTTGLGGYFMSRATNRFLPFLSLFLLSASAVAADDGWRVVELPMEAAPNYFREYCFLAERDGTLQVEASTRYAVVFNVHFHTDTDTYYPVRETIQGDVVFEIPVKAGTEYCPMATNPDRKPETFVVTTRYRIR